MTTCYTRGVCTISHISIRVKLHDREPHMHPRDNWQVCLFSSRTAPSSHITCACVFTTQIHARESRFRFLDLISGGAYDRHGEHNVRSMGTRLDGGSGRPGLCTRRDRAGCRKLAISTLSLRILVMDSSLLIAQWQRRD
jgi:hypothetical protein